MLFRQAVTLSLALIIFLSASAPAPAAGLTFSDVAGHWARGDIALAVEQGLAGGYPDATFRPDGSITRAEFVKLAVRSRGLTAAPGSGGFSDLVSHWLNDQGYIEAAVGAGLIVVSDYGTPPLFSPNQPITRLEVAVIASRVLGRQGANWSLRGAALSFSDAGEVPFWASGSVAVVRSAGVLSGYPDGSFGGDRTITRAEAVVVANRLTARRDQTEVPVWEGNSWRVTSFDGLPGTPNFGLSGVAAAPDGTLYVQVRAETWQIPAGGAPRLFYRHPTAERLVIAAGADGIFLAERGRIWQVTAEGEAIPWVGGAEPGDSDGQGEAAGLSYVQSLCADPGGGLFVVESSPGRIRRVNANREVRTLAVENPAQPGYPRPEDGPAGQATLYLPSGCAVDRAGNLYFSDLYPGRAIRRLAPDGSISWYAGYRWWFGYGDGTVSEARFGNIAGLSLDELGNLWVIDEGSQRIRRISPDGNVHTVAGSGFEVQPYGNWLMGGHQDGLGPEARFSNPNGIALAGGKLYVSQASGPPLRVISGDASGYTGRDVAGLVPLAFGNKARRLDPLPLPGELPALAVALYTPVVDLALKANGAEVYRSGPDGGAVRSPLSPVWRGGRPGSYELTLSVGLPDGRRLESLPVTGEAE